MSEAGPAQGPAVTPQLCPGTAGLRALSPDCSESRVLLLGHTQR